MNTHYKRFRNFLGVIAGNAILAYGVAAFYIPAGLAVGGSTGVGVILLTFLVVSADSLIYSLLALAVEMLVMDRIMVLGTSQLQLLVMSGRHERVREELMTRLEAGVTLLHSETGWQRRDSKAILCVIPKKRLYAVKEIVHDIDPAAFITVAEVKEVQGRGFSIERIPLPAGK